MEEGKSCAHTVYIMQLRNILCIPITKRTDDVQWQKFDASEIQVLNLIINACLFIHNGVQTKNILSINDQYKQVVQF